MIIPLAELLAPVVEALSTIPAGVVPSVKEEPHSEFNPLDNVEAVLGKSVLRTLKASLTQFEQVIFVGRLVVVNAFSITSPMLLILSVPRILWMLDSV